jgi:ribosomal protein S12 methylthiotransferase accessory factor
MSLAALVSPYVGVVRSLDELLAGTADPPLPTFSCDPVDDDRLVGAPLGAIGGVCGIGLDREAAIGAALGETAERYSLCALPTERLIHRPAAALRGAVPPGEFGLFDEEQLRQPDCPFARFTDDTVVPWIDGRELQSGELAWLPAELVLLSDPVVPGGTRIGYATSSGAACAATVGEAVLKGLFELLERDAFMIAWASRLSLPRIDWRGHQALCELDRRYFARTGLEYAAIDLSAFHGIPSVLAVVRAPAGAGARIGVGAGTDATIERAWWKALSEAFACRAAASRLALLRPGRTLADDGSNVGSFEDHIRFYDDPVRIERTRFLDDSAERVDVREIAPLQGDLDEQTESVLQRIDAAGSAAYAVDVTATDVASLGFHVVKTVAPGLCMLDVLHRARFLGNSRLLTAAAAEVNPDPHPFP